MARQQPAFVHGEWLAVPGEMARDIRDVDWTATPLGPRERWPHELRHALRLCLDSPQPMALYWGPDFCFLYNDALRSILGNRHPEALGRSASDIWSEEWAIVGGMLQGVWASGEAVWSEGRPLLPDRHGSAAERRHSYSLSPVRDDVGAVRGIVCAVTDTTARADRLLAESDRAPTAILSNIGHQFRTPLTLMLGPLDDVLDDELSPTLRESLTVVRRNGQRLLKLVDGLLDLSAIETGWSRARYEPVDLAAFTAALAEAFRPAVEGAGLDFEVSCPPLRSPVHVDRHHFETIVLHLLSNALKYTPSGRITLRLGESSDGAVLAVVDTGIGIPAAALPRLFDRFYRVEGARGRTHEGAGLGLALVAGLVRLHGGTTSAESVEGQGSEFVVRLPFGAAHLPAGQIVAPAAGPSPGAAGTFVEAALGWLPAASAGAPPAIPGAATSKAARWQDAGGERPTILLADDNPDMRHYVGSLLEEGCEVIRVTDGVEALAALDQRVPDLVITDATMPGLDGIGLVRALRAREDTAAVPVILLSADAADSVRRAGFAAGVDDYLVKPFSARALIARVSATLARAAARREAARTLRESEERFRHMADNAPVMVRVTEADGRCSFLSRSWYDFTGQPLDGALGFGWLGATHPDDREATEAALLEANARRQPLGVEYRLRRHDGEYRWALDAAVPRRGVEGEHLGLVGSVIDITERKEAERRREGLLEAERQARVEAERVNRMKDEFLTTLSHELRTPLNAILGWAQVIDRDGVAPADVRRGLAAINRNARAQTQMIEDLLDMSRIVSGKIRLEIRAIHLADVIEEAVLSALPSAAACGLRLERIIDEGPDTVAGDPERLQQVFWNLLTNAIKFTPAGGRVDVRLQHAGPRLEVSVRDTGQGLDAAIMPHLFERFRQADASTTRRLGGLGLGLSIVRDLVELHGGEVRAESPGPRLGATFTVSLPLATGPTGPAPPPA